MALLKTLHKSTITHQSQSAEILAALETHPAFRAANIILLYHSLPDEVDTHDFIRKWSTKKQILLPVVVGDDLELRVYTGPADLTPGAYGIEEPTGALFTDYAAGRSVRPQRKSFGTREGILRPTASPHTLCIQSRHLFPVSTRRRSSCGAFRHPYG